ncbi:hypothetical protein FJU08_20470 [Martelella alba]|uniref:Uncharacterized protein n=1 Tax=Martelella alba TaxID=2590451 RepID=A0A506TZ69_9HYPH|nr:hypothetical protein [Martelella alba]TPW27382.1 hypothetical protein FJU08_20470 [Martelella alba]
MGQADESKMVKRLNTTLPDPLAAYVGEITGKGTLYETPSEFIRDLVRRHMERALEQERNDMRSMLAQSLRENDDTSLSANDFDDARRVASE